METKSQSLNSLDTSGRKLLGNLSSQEDAVMLQRRLEEMNQRWNQLKNRSVTIRYLFTFIIYIFIFVHRCNISIFKIKLKKYIYINNC